MRRQVFGAPLYHNRGCGLAAEWPNETYYSRIRFSHYIKNPQCTVLAWAHIVVLESDCNPTYRIRRGQLRAGSARPGNPESQALCICRIEGISYTFGKICTQWPVWTELWILRPWRLMLQLLWFHSTLWRTHHQARRPSRGPDLMAVPAPATWW